MAVELTEDRMPWGDRVLRRVRALDDVAGADPGELGGWVEHDENIVHEGWVADHAMAMDEVKVAGKAVLGGTASATGRARISGQARIDGIVTIGDDAFVTGSATITDTAAVFGNARVVDGHISGTVLVHGSALILGRVSGDAVVSGEAVVPLEAHVGDRGSLTRPEHVLVVVTDELTITCYRTDSGAWLTAGDWTGPIDSYARRDGVAHHIDLIRQAAAERDATTQAGA